MTDNILLVDDDPGTIQLLASIIGDLGKLRFATAGTDALRLARELVPDLLVLDAEMPDMSGFQVLQAFKADALLADVPAIFVTSHSDPAFEVAGFELGAADFIAKPVSPALLRARVRTQLRMKHLSDELRRFSVTDALTGIGNRRGFDEALEREWRVARRIGKPLALLSIDVDHFKRYNDLYGHPAGDNCLRLVAHALAGASLRPADVLARYGGEEFAMLLPQTPRAGAEHIAHRVLEAVRALAVPHADSPTSPYMSVSVGVGYYDEASICWTSPAAYSRPQVQAQLDCSSGDLVQAADRALYKAKNAGRARARMVDIAEACKTRAAAAVAQPPSTPPAA